MRRDWGRTKCSTGVVATRPAYVAGVPAQSITSPPANPKLFIFQRQIGREGRRASFSHGKLCGRPVRANQQRVLWDGVLGCVGVCMYGGADLLAWSMIATIISTGSNGINRPAVAFWGVTSFRLPRCRKVYRHLRLSHFATFWSFLHSLPSLLLLPVEPSLFYFVTLECASSA